MERRRLGTSELEASLVGLGCNNFGMKIDLPESRAVVDAALDAGIDFLDTADLYGGTQSESFLGEVLEGRRDRVVLATKFGGLALGKEKPWGTSAYIQECVEASLARLRTDRIDLYQIHYPDPKTPIAETLEALSRLVAAGKVRALGCSNFGADLIEAASAAADGGGGFVTVQNQWSLLEREVEKDVVPASEKHGLSLLPYFPLASGMLTGKYRRGQPYAEGTRLAALSYFENFATEANFDAVESLDAFAREQGRSLLELAMSWLAAQPTVASVIAGATRPDQVRANAAAVDWRLGPAELDEVDRILASLTLQ